MAATGTVRQILARVALAFDRGDSIAGLGLETIGREKARGRLDIDDDKIVELTDKVSERVEDPVRFATEVERLIAAGAAKVREEPPRVTIGSVEWKEIAEAFHTVHSDRHPTFVSDNAIGRIYRYTRDVGWHEEFGFERYAMDFLSRLDVISGEDLVPFGDSIDKRNSLRRSVIASSVDVHGKPIPCWIGDKDRDLSTWLVCENGIVDMAKGRLMRHDPRVFALGRIAVRYDPKAPEPTEWLAMLDRVQRDKEAIRLLQQWFGYCLDGSFPVYQKALWLYGQPRSGKGTITRVLSNLLGTTARTAEFSNFAGPHALEDVYGARLLTFPEVKVDQRSRATAVGRLLSIIGNDPVQINPKGVPAFSTTLNTRIMFASNDLPSGLADKHGGLAARLMFFETEGSWAGREDPDMENRIMAELPGILLWAIEGWHDLQREGKFVIPESSRRVRERFQKRSSSLSDFLAENYEVTGHKSDFVPWKRVRETYKAWCEENAEKPLPMGKLSDFLLSTLVRKNPDLKMSDLPRHRDKGSTVQVKVVPGMKPIENPAE